MESDVQRELNRWQVKGLQVAITTTRRTRNLSRETVAMEMGIPKYRIDQFDDGKVPWETITLSFMQRYAYVVGLTLGISIAERPGYEEEE